MVSLKKKVLLGVPAILIGIMLIATFVVSMITSRQSREAARQLLQNASNIVSYTLSERQDKLLFDSRQMAALDDMGGKIKYVTDSSPYFKFSIMRPTYITIATTLYNIGTSAEIWKAAIYDLNGDVIAFVMNEDDASTLGYIHNRDTIEIALSKSGQQLTPELWTVQKTLPDIGIRQDKAVNKDTTHFEIAGDSLCLSAHVPIMGKDYNPQTEKMELRQVGTLVTIQKLDNDFARKLSDLTEMDVNIFGANGLITGTIGEYKTFDLSPFAGTEIPQGMAAQQVIFDDITLSSDSYFQGILPIYSDSECVAVITSLYSKKIARANTAQVIKLLSLVYVICIVLIVPGITLVVVRGIINPIQKTVSMMREITQKKDFNKMLRVESHDEIGQLASAFNMMTEELKNTTTSIDNLNEEIAERKKAEEELQQLLSLHDATLEATADGILVVDLTGNIITRNHMFLQLWHISETMAANKEDKKQLAYVLDQLTSPEEFIAEVQRLYAHPEESSSDLLEFKDGRVFERSSRPQKIGEKIVGRVWSFRDITERRKAEEELLNAKKCAEEANETKSMFLANTSHEIRTPMNAILGFGELLVEENLTAEQKQYTEAILSSGRGLLQIINDILDFSKIEAKKIILDILDCSPFQILDELESLFKSSCIKKGIDFNILYCSELPQKIRTDPVRLRQCLTNLIGNAIKFTEKGHVYLNIGLEKIDSNLFIRFDVEDTGIGIPKEKQGLVFEAFTQADGSHTRKFGGTGLGLSITKQLVELLGGTISLASEKERGSVFSILLPAGAAIDSQPMINRYQMPKPSQKEEDDKSVPMTGKILVAEDAKANQVLIRILLQKLGLEVTIVEDGRQAVEQAETGQYDLILMDIQMPVMNGYEATNVIRSMQLMTPIIALTAHAMRGDEEKCRDAGCNDYLTKPINRSKMVQMLRKYLSTTENCIATPQTANKTEVSDKPVELVNPPSE